jgi:histidinol-phosphate aminotransferase
MVVDTFRRHGIDPLPSQTNFVFADIGRNVDVFGERMRERNVRVHRAYPNHESYMRVSMGKLEDIEVFSDVFSELYTA